MHQGTMIGPFIGGALASPCTNFGPHFPLCHESGLFQRRSEACTFPSASLLIYI
jgi:hypothetical protein